MGKRHPDKIKVIVVNQVNCRNKYLVPKSLLLCHFLHILRSRLELNKTETILLFSENTLLLSTDTINQIFAKHGKEGVVYITFSREACFG